MGSRSCGIRAGGGRVMLITEMHHGAGDVEREGSLYSARSRQVNGGLGSSVVYRMSLLGLEGTLLFLAHRQCCKTIYHLACFQLSGYSRSVKPSSLWLK